MGHYKLKKDRNEHSNLFKIVERSVPNLFFVSVHIGLIGKSLYLIKEDKE